MLFGLNRLNILQTDILPRWHKFGYIGDDQYFVSRQGKTVESWNDVI